MQGYVSIDYVKKMLKSFKWDSHQPTRTEVAGYIQFDIRHYLYDISRHEIINKEKFNGKDNTDIKAKVLGTMIKSCINMMVTELERKSNHEIQK